jgi:hypothetical protein
MHVCRGSVTRGLLRKLPSCAAIDVESPTQDEMKGASRRHTKNLSRCLLLAILLTACGSSGLRVRTGVAKLEMDDGCAHAETPQGAGWSGMQFCFLERDDRTLGVFASLAAPNYSPQGLALLAKPETDLEFYLEDGKSFHAKTDAVGFVSLEVTTKSPIAYFLIRYSPSESLKCDAELGGPVCEPAA